LGIFVAAITGAMFMPEGSSWTMLGFAIVLGIIVVFCIRAIISIKKFLAQPVWAVEALAYCKL
jgi:predicted membrane channel-forming protein YqfA (hemolysin III family)